MAKNVKINGVTYSDVPSVEIPLATGSGSAEFFDTSDATLDSGGKMLSGNTAYADGVKYGGTIVSKSASDLTASGATVTVPAGYYGSQATKSVASGSALEVEILVIECVAFFWPQSQQQTAHHEPCDGFWGVVLHSSDKLPYLLEI